MFGDDIDGPYNNTLGRGMLMMMSIQNPDLLNVQYSRVVGGEKQEKIKDLLSEDKLKFEHKWI